MVYARILCDQKEYGIAHKHNTEVTAKNGADI